jgi:protein-disulfide isomerase
MNVWRFTPLLLLALLTTGATCNRKTEETGASPSDPGHPKVELPGVDISSLTEREHQVWSSFVGELLSPCADVAVPVAQCVLEKRPCDLCVDAARFLVRQVQAGLPKKDVSALYAARFDAKAVKTIVIGDSAAKGSADPAVTIVEFADFECPACGMAAPLLEQMYAKYGANMRLVFKHYPLEAHLNAKLAAQAAYAAQKQGQFWKMHRVLFANQLRLSEPDLIEHAKTIGLDVERFTKDMHSDEAKAQVDNEKRQGEGLGVAATPTLFINGRDCDLSKLANPMKDLEEWIALELRIAAKVGGKAPATASSAQPRGAP